jgi:hypothetical protein
MLRGFRRSVLIVLTGLLVLSPIVATLSTSVAAAAQPNPQDQLERWFYYRGMRACLDDPDFAPNTPVDDNGDRSSSDINEGHILPGDATGGGQPKKGFGYLAPDMDGADDNDGTVSCTDGSIFARGASLFGFKNVVGLVCAMNSALSKDDNGRIEPSHPTDCEQSTKFHFDGGGGGVFQQALTKALEQGGSKDRPSFQINDNNGPDYTSGALLYLIGAHSLEIFCGNGASLEAGSANGGNIDDKNIVSVDYIAADGTVKASQPYALADPDRDEDSKVDDVYYNQGGDDNNAKDLKCYEMAAMTRDNSSEYAKWAVKHLDELAQNVSGTKGSDSSDNPTGGADDTTTCAIDGIGWIVCPVMNFLGKLNDKAFGFLQKLLTIRPSLVTDTTTRKAWSAFRDIANVAFIIAFLVIVYSQVTSAGVSNYGIKKLLPRIMIAAVLVNLSYFACAILVDISNIAGASLYSLLGTGIDVGTIPASSDGTTWEGVMTGILAVTAGVLLVVVIAAAPVVLLAVAAILLILIARQAFIVLLIVASPLAFVAYLLPNTESFFKKWWKAFSATLMIYPIVGVVFGASTLASKILMGAATKETGDDSTLLKIVALSVMAIPLFAIPSILKGAMSGAGAVGAKLSNLQDNLNRRSSAAVKDRAGKEYGDMRNRAASRMLGSNSRAARTASFLTGTGRRAKREDRYKQNQTLRDANQENFLNQGINLNDPSNSQNLSKTAQKRVAAGAAQKTAGATNQLIGNMGASSSLASNPGLHAAVAESNIDLHHREEVEKNKGETKYFDKPENAEHVAEGLTARENRQAAETNATNRAKTGLTPPSTAVRQAIADNKQSKGEEKMVDQGLELDYQKSDVGRSQSKGIKAVEGELEIVHSQQKNEFDSSTVGVSQSQQKRVVNAQQKITDTTADIAYETSDEGSQLNLHSQVAQDTLGAAKAETDAVISELRAGPEAAGIVPGSDPEIEQIAVDLSAADIQKRVQTQRAASAGHVTNVQYQQAVKASEGVANGIAEQAGGIDVTSDGVKVGATRAVAAATQAIDRELGENIAMQKTTLESVSVPQLFTVMKDTTAPAEKRAAAAGLLMKNGGDQHVQEVIDYLGTVDATPSKDAYGNDIPNQDIAVLQKQVAADIGARKPKGVGRSDITAMAEGGYGKNGFKVETEPDGTVKLNPDGTPKTSRKAAKSYEDSLVKRFNDGKFSEQTIADMGEDELARVANVIVKRGVGNGPGQVTEAQYKIFTNDIDKIRTNDTLRGKVSGPQISGILDAIKTKSPPDPFMRFEQPDFDRTR